MGAGELSLSSITTVRTPSLDGTVPGRPNTAVPFCASDTATKSCCAGGNALAVSQTRTRSLSITGSAPWLNAAAPKARTHSEILSMQRFIQARSGRRGGGSPSTTESRQHADHAVFAGADVGILPIDDGVTQVYFHFVRAGCDSQDLGAVVALDCLSALYTIDEHERICRGAGHDDLSRVRHRRLARKPTAGGKGSQGNQYENSHALRPRFATKIGAYHAAPVSTTRSFSPGIPGDTNPPARQCATLCAAEGSPPASREAAAAAHRRDRSTQRPSGHRPWLLRRRIRTIQDRRPSDRSEPRWLRYDHRCRRRVMGPRVPHTAATEDAMDDPFP